jgi:hypothetical protein
MGLQWLLVKGRKMTFDDSSVLEKYTPALVEVRRYSK